MTLPKYFPILRENMLFLSTSVVKSRIDKYWIRPKKYRIRQVKKTSDPTGSESSPLKWKVNMFICCININWMDILLQLRMEPVHAFPRKQCWLLIHLFMSLILFITLLFIEEEKIKFLGNKSPPLFSNRKYIPLQYHAVPLYGLTWGLRLPRARWRKVGPGWWSVLEEPTVRTSGRKCSILNRKTK